MTGLREHILEGWMGGWMGGLRGDVSGSAWRCML